MADSAHITPPSRREVLTIGAAAVVLAATPVMASAPAVADAWTDKILAFYETLDSEAKTAMRYTLHCVAGAKDDREARVYLHDFARYLEDRGIDRRLHLATTA